MFRKNSAEGKKKKKQIKPFLTFSKNLKPLQAYNDWSVIGKALFHNTWLLSQGQHLAVNSKKLHKKGCRHEWPGTAERRCWVLKQTWTGCALVTAGCAEEFRMTCSRAIVTNLLSPPCAPRGTSSRNVWKPCNQPWDPRRKCLADGKHRCSCCVPIFGNKGCHPEIHDIKEPPDCFARGDTKVAKVITCTSCNLMVKIKSIIAFQNEKTKQRANWGVHRI